MSLSFGIESKPDIESIIGSSDLIPENELHVQKETEYAKKLESVDPKVSVALVAKTDERYYPDYTIGFIENVRIVLNDIQARPLIINHGMVKRSIKEFTHNDIYPTYALEIVSPPMELLEFCRHRGALQPLASPDGGF